MKSSTKIIIFNIDIADSQNIFGFKLLNNTDAKQYLKCIKLLENNNSEFTTGSESYEYSSQYFSVMNVSTSDLKVLQKFFDVDIEDSDINTVGFFPNAIEDAYEEGLLDENQEEQNQDSDYEEQEDF